MENSSPLRTWSFYLLFKPQLLNGTIPGSILTAGIDYENGVISTKFSTLGRGSSSLWKERGWDICWKDDDMKETPNFLKSAKFTTVLPPSGLHKREDLFTDCSAVSVSTSSHWLWRWPFNMLLYFCSCNNVASHLKHGRQGTALWSSTGQTRGSSCIGFQTVHRLSGWC